MYRYPIGKAKVVRRTDVRCAWGAIVVSFSPHEGLLEDENTIQY